MTKEIILTGGTGFIGSKLLERLLSENKKVVLLKRSFSNTWRINEFKENPNLSFFDLDKDDLSELFYSHSIEGIFHLATFAQRIHESQFVSKMIDSNINFPVNLLEYSINSNVNFFINTGSFSEFLSSVPIPINCFRHW